MWVGLYQLGLAVFKVALPLLGIFHKKLREFSEGQQENTKHLESLKGTLAKPIWVHCSSAGEYEQAKPLLEALKTHYPNQQTVLSFFSPSGFNTFTENDFVDEVCYLALDTRKNAAAFIDCIQPRLAIFVKYDLWYNHVMELKRRSIPSFLVSAVVRKNHYYFRHPRKFFKAPLLAMSHIFVQDEESNAVLREHGMDNVSVSGDTRFDRVEKIASDIEGLPALQHLVNSNESWLVAGSTWPKDEACLADLSAKQPDLNLIIAPHEIEKTRLQGIDQLFGKQCTRYSELSDVSSGFPESKPKIIVLDNYGLLSKVYRLGAYAYVGGGFGAGIHNSLEPAVYGCPIFFGPNYGKFKEAIALKEIGVAFPIQDSQSLIEKIESLSEQDLLRIKDQAKLFFEKNIGGTEKIMRGLTSYLQD